MQRARRPWRSVVASAAVLTLSLQVGAHGVMAVATRVFFDDDPLWVEADTEDASGVQRRRTSYAWDAVDNLWLDPGDPITGVRAGNVNTVDEVPDSSWFTNRIGRFPMTSAELLRANTTGPPADGTWTIVSAKTDGRTPGFVIEDRHETRWFVKFDAPGHKGMATGSEVLVNRLFWALGYNVPEYHVAFLEVDRLALSPDARIEPRGFHARRMKVRDIRRLLQQADREPDGSFRVSASRALEGTPVGPFRFYGTRPDDPNDVVAHEHRRELRALRVFSAWVNHVEVRAGNTLDTLEASNGRTVVRHHLIDFGSTLGSGGLQMRPWWEGHSYLFEGDETWKSAVTLGFWVPRWRRLRVFEEPTIGRLPALDEPFDPHAWKPGIPNAAFRHLRADDAFWAARRVMAFTDEMLGEVVRAGVFADPQAETFLVRSLILRRDAIGRAYLVPINPIVDPRLEAGHCLVFGNAAVDARLAPAPAGYVATWSQFDNATGGARPIGITEGGGPSIEAPPGLPTQPGQFVRVEIAARGGAHPAWEQPVRAHFQRRADGQWRLVGFERLPESLP